MPLRPPLPYGRVSSSGGISLTHLGTILCRCARHKPSKHTARQLIVFHKEADCRACHAHLSKQGVQAIKHVKGSSMLCCHLDTRVSWEGLRNHPAVRYVEADRRATAHPAAGVLKIAKATAPRVTWNIRQVQAPRVWPVSRGEGVRLAIVDTGIARHPDLRIAGGINTLGGRSYYDDNGHGTHVAGIAAGLGAHGGQAGVAPRVRLYAVKVLDSYGFGFISDIVEGIDWCIRNRMQVMNMSFGLEPGVRSRALRDVIRRAARSGIVMAASAGNAGVASGGIDSPASYPEPIAVAASTRSGRVAALSSRGSGIGLTAPGQNIRSTWPGGGYKILSGTSMATPHVAGAAALLLSAKPRLNAKQVRQALETSAKRLRGATSIAEGRGLLQSACALQRTLPCSNRCARRQRAKVAAP